MANSSRRFRINAWLAAPALFFAVFIVAAGAGNYYLGKNKSYLLDSLNRHFEQKFSVGNIRYIPPHIIVISNLLFVQPPSQQLLAVPRMHIYLSIPDLFLRHSLIISDIVFIKPRVYEPYFYAFLQNYARKIIDFLLSLPQRDITLVVEDATLNAAGHNSMGRRLSLDLDLLVKTGLLAGRGVISEERNAVCDAGNIVTSCISHPVPVEFRFRGLPAGNTLTIESLEVLRENCYTKVWGGFDNNVLALNGFSFVNTRFREREYLTPTPTLLDRFMIFLRLKQVRLPKLAMSDVDLFILDIDSALDIRWPRVDIQRLRFSLDNIPLSVKGVVRGENPASYDLTIVSDMERHVDKRLAHFKKITLVTQGDISLKSLNANGAVEIAYSKAGNEGYPYERSTIGFKGLKCSWSAFPSVQMRIAELQSAFETGSNTYKLDMRDVAARVSPGSKKNFNVAFKGLLYDGTITGKALMDISTFPVKVDSTMRVRGVTADNLKGLLVHFSKIQGRLFSQMRFRSYPQSSLKGAVSIQNGYLHDFDFFKWLADFFGLPSLQGFSFGKVFLNFGVDNESARLQKITLRSRDLAVSGYFTLGKKDMVNSKLSLGFSRRLMEQSEKLKPMMRILSPAIDPINFDFQLSGNLHNMNFHWLDSELKTHVQKAIPGFIERRIEQNIENYIAEAEIK